MSRARLTTTLAFALLAASCASTGELSSATTQATAPSTTVAAIEDADSVVEATSEPGVDETVAPDIDETVGTTSTTQVEDVCVAPGSQGRVDVRTDGNRISEASIDLSSADVLDVQLPAAIDWIVPNPEGGWFATTVGGGSFAVTASGDVEALEAATATPPVVAFDGSIGTAFDEHGLFAEPLIDGRVVRSESVLAVLASPTDRYAHGVLGDAIEAAAVEWVDVCNDSSGRIDIAAPDVIEGVAPILADIDDDGQIEVLVTVSNSSGGARLAVYELDGTLLAESAPIGRGNRWRNQLGAGPFGPGGEIEIIDVQTPHIGGIVQAFQLVEGESGASLERVAFSVGAFTSHPINTRNLDMGIALDADGDEDLDVLVAGFERDRLVALTRINEFEGWEQVGEVTLPGRLTSNVAVSNFGGPAVAAAAGATMRIWQ